MAKNKAKKNPPPRFSRALTLLRLAFNWEQSWVAEVSGRSPQSVSDLERGRTLLERPELEAIVCAAGGTPADVEAALEFLDKIDHRQAAPILPGDSGPDLEDLVAQAADGIRAVLSQVHRRATAVSERRQAEITWPQLARIQDPRKRELLVAASSEFRGWALAERACLESRRMAAHDPKEALELAELALAIAELSPGEPALGWRVQGLALFTVANAWRVCGRLPVAREKWNEGKKLWQAGAGADPGFSEIQVQSLEISLLTSERKLGDALKLADLALENARGEVVVDLYLQKANVLELMGEYQAVITLLRAVEPRLGNATEPRKLWLQRYSLMNNLCHLGRVEEAARLLPAIRRLTDSLGNMMDQTRLKGLEGRIAAGQGKWKEAAHPIEEAREVFAAQGMHFDTALATLELAAVYLELGRLDKVKGLTARLVPIFEQQGMHEEARKALALFCKAVEQEIATAELARQIVAFLYRAQGDSGLRFELPG